MLILIHQTYIAWLWWWRWSWIVVDNGRPGGGSGGGAEAKWPRLGGDTKIGTPYAGWIWRPKCKWTPSGTTF
jgi:hypothetical protein